MITSSEIRQHTFKKGIRGFDADEVKAFLGSLAQEFEVMHSENRATKVELDTTKENLQRFREMESILHKTLLQAEQSTQALLQNAQRDAEIRLQEAENQANEMLHNTRVECEMKKQEAEQKAVGILTQAYADKSRIEQDIHQLTMSRTEVLSQLKLFLGSQLERINTFADREAISLTRHHSSTIEQVPVQVKAQLKTNGSVKASNPEIPSAVESHLLKAIHFGQMPARSSSTKTDILTNPPRSFFESNVVTADRSGILSSLADQLE